MSAFIKRQVISDMSCCRDLSQRDVDVLRHVLIHENGITPAFLSNVTRFDPATILRANIKLVEGGYIQIVEHHIDSRAHLVFITPKGRAALAHLTKIYLEKQSKIIPHVLPELEDDVLKTVFTTCLDLQERAERLASFLPNGKLRTNSVTELSRQHFRMSFEEFKKHPELVLHLYCHRTHTDYLTFLKAHAISKLSTGKLMNIRELRVLMALEYFDHHATAMDVANVLRFDPATVSRAVVALKDYGFIATSQFEDPDERKKPLTLSSKGQSIASEYLELIQNAITLAETRLSLPLEQDKLQRFLSVLLLLRERASYFASIKQRRSNIMSLNHQAVA